MDQFVNNLLAVMIAFMQEILFCLMGIVTDLWVFFLFCISGTRYRRRGVDDNGDVANFVETEQV